MLHGPSQLDPNIFLSSWWLMKIITAILRTALLYLQDGFCFHVSHAEHHS